MNSRLFSKRIRRNEILKGVTIAAVLLIAVSPLGRNKISSAFEGAFRGMFETVVDNVQERSFTHLKGGTGDGPSKPSQPRNDSTFKPQVEVPYDLKVVEREQKSVDEGHQPWKLDPVFVAQVFVSLKLSPGGIQGEYPIKYEDLKLVKNTEKDAVVEVNSPKSPIKRVYLKRLIRQDKTGIWTVVGYDPVNNR